MLVQQRNARSPKSEYSILCVKDLEDISEEITCETKKLGFDNDKSANELNSRDEALKEMKAENE